MAAETIILMSIWDDLLDSSSSSDSEDEIVATTLLRLNKEKRPKIENVGYNYTEKQEQELTYDDADCHDEMDESEPVGGVQDDPNNEVEIIDDSSEVPNQSGGSSSSISAAPEQSGVGGSNGEDGGAGGGGGGGRDDGGGNSGVQQAPGASLASQSEAISSGSEGQSATPSVPIFPRGRNQVTPLSSSSSSRQQQSTSHLLLHPGGYDEAGGGDDGIVPSTPTLYVPRRTDGFGEAVSSPHVPSGRFTFGETSSGASAGRGGGIGVASQGDGIDDTRVDLSQLDESGTGRSVPSTPLQVSPQGEPSTEGSSEVGPSVEEQSELPTEPTQGEDIPLITVTLANNDEAETSSQQDRNNEPAPGGGDDVGDSGGASSVGPATAGPSGSTTTEGRRSTPTLTPGAPDGQDDVVVGGDELLESEEGMDGVSSEGEKPQAMEDTEIEEGREAEATESPSSNTRSRSHGRGLATARRSNRIPFRHRHQHRPTPIVWNETQQQHHHQQQQQRSGSSGSGVGGQQQHHDVGGVARGRGTLSDSPVRGNFATRHRARRVRQLRGPFGRF